MIIEATKYLPEDSFLKRVIADKKPDATAIAFFQMFDKSDYVSLRDRTEEMTWAVLGIAHGMQSKNLEVVTVTMKGFDLANQYGKKCVGAQFAQTFRIILV